MELSELLKAVDGGSAHPLVLGGPLVLTCRLLLLLGAALAHVIGTAAYRRHALRVLTRRALDRCLA